MPDATNELLKMKEKIKRAETDSERSDAIVQSTMEEIKKKHGIKSLNALTKKIDDLEKEVLKVSDEFEKDMSQLKEKMAAIKNDSE